MDRQTLASMIDHTCLKPDATYDDLKKLCDEAKQMHAAMVAINSAPVAFCKKQLKNSEVRVGAAISFPLGQTPLRVKLFEVEQAIRDGADEIDYVVNLTDVKAKRWDVVREEMMKITAACHAAKVICKVIFETCYLEEKEIIALAKIAADVRPDFIKTSTGFGSAGAKVEHVRLMKQVVKDKVKVKAAGGIRDLHTCLAMIQAGAERIGTSSSLRILDELLEAGERQDKW